MILMANAMMGAAGYRPVSAVSEDQYHILISDYSEAELNSLFSVHGNLTKTYEPADHGEPCLVVTNGDSVSDFLRFEQPGQLDGDWDIWVRYELVGAKHYSGLRFHVGDLSYRIQTAAGTSAGPTAERVFIPGSFNNVPDEYRDSVRELPLLSRMRFGGGSFSVNTKNAQFPGLDDLWTYPNTAPAQTGYLDMSRGTPYAADGREIAIFEIGVGVNGTPAPSLSA